MSNIIVGLSGGVDSSVSALLLKQQGHTVEGLFMKNWEEDDTDTYCAAETDLKDAQAVCHTLDIKLHTVNFSSEYWDNVFVYFLQEYKAGRTPNPDILCNREIKFKLCLDYAKKLGADFFATGHYAQNNHNQLYKSQDPTKDQTYFIYTLTQNLLSQIVFPIGHLLKSDVRQLAQKAGLMIHDKKDSTGICFIGERRFKTFLQHYLPAQPGLIKSTDGKIMGEHDGLMYYTRGQRQGIKIGGQRNSTGEPWYVIDKDLEHNNLIIGQGHEHPRLYTHKLEFEQAHWINDTVAFPDNLSCKAKTRYRQIEEDCVITRLHDTTYQAQFIKPHWAVTPGQSIVFYQNNECLGGGIIN